MSRLEPRGAGDPVRTKSDVTVTLGCNNHCPFCPRSTLKHIRVGSDQELHARLRAVREGSSRVVLTGGEVTIRSDFVELVAHCKALGFEQIGVISNGRRFADAAFARRAAEAGLTEACVTVYDQRPEVHDTLTGTPGSLEETLRGLDNLLGLRREYHGLGVRVNTLLCASNAPGLHALLRELAARGVRRVLVAEVLLSEQFDQPVEHARVVELARDVLADLALASVSVSWRGLPRCLFTDLPGVELEAHEIDTALIDERSQGEYFREFYGNFAHVEACHSCAEKPRCVGLQRRYLARYGGAHLTPLRGNERKTALAAARRELAGLPPWPESERLELVVTASCPLRCSYCAVELSPRHAPAEVLDRAVDLLLATPWSRPELQLFGGEPLLRKDEVVRCLRRASERARALGKELRFCVTTNGLLLDAELLEFLATLPVKIMFSFDGPPEVMATYRPPARAGGAIERALRRLVDSGVDYFVNMVVTPEAVADLPRRLRYVMALGARTIQICYALGPGWTDEAQVAFVGALRECAAIAASGKVRLQNLGSAAEPTVLSNDLLVDVDGALYGDAAFFAEKALPGLRRPLRLGQVFELKSLEGLRRSREENLVTLRNAYPPGSPTRALLEEQLAFGRRVQQALGEIESNRKRDDENPLQALVLRRSLARQAEVMRARPALLALPILMLENACYHDCLFCLPKALPPTPLERVTSWLEDNCELGLSRLGLAGNEPLAHPEIERILAAARAAGFSRFDVLSSGAPLADPARARAFASAGVTGYAFPLYADEPAGHDAITQAPGSWEATVRAIENVLALGAEVHVHANLLRQNLDRLEALEALVAARWGRELSVIPVRAKSANLPFAALMPRYREIIARARVKNLVGFPLCVAEKVQSPPVPNGRVLSDILKLYVLDQPFVKPPKCQGCRWRERCTGTFRAYLDLYGDQELSPS